MHLKNTLPRVDDYFRDQETIGSVINNMTGCTTIRTVRVLRGREIFRYNWVQISSQKSTSNRISALLLCIYKHKYPCWNCAIEMIRHVKCLFDLILYVPSTIFQL